MHQAGLLDHALRSASLDSTKNPCSLSGQKTNRNGPIYLKLRDFSGTFVILAAGVGFSFLVLIGECIFKYIT